MRFKAFYKFVLLNANMKTLDIRPRVFMFAKRYAYKYF